jgi:two-component system, NtrC family, response regulator HydG
LRAFEKLDGRADDRLSEKRYVQPAISILLVEDDRSTAYLVEHILVSGNFAVDVVSTASAALQRLTEHQYRLVISDLRLPDGDGIAVADRAAELGMKTAILTGYALSISPEQAAEHEVWMKPMRPVELIAAAASFR